MKKRGKNKYSKYFYNYSFLSILLIIIFVFLFVSYNSQWNFTGKITQTNVCGDRICNVAEEPLGSNPCAQDCPTSCIINGVCNKFETFSSCSRDCTISRCGNGNNYCDAYYGETNLTCPYDCSQRCGNLKCESPEDYLSCPRDCSPSCGNAICEIHERFATCPQDCNISRCGDSNNLCQSSVGENGVTCPYDCSPRCGNKKCESNTTYTETHKSCLSDCPWEELNGWTVYSPGKLVPEGYNITSNSIILTGNSSDKLTALYTRHYFPGDNLSFTFQNRTATLVTFSILQPSLSSVSPWDYGITSYSNGKVGSQFEQGNYAGNYGTFYCYLTGFSKQNNPYFFNPQTINGESISNPCGTSMIYSILSSNDPRLGVIPHSLRFSFLPYKTNFSISPPYDNSLYSPPLSGQTNSQLVAHSPYFPMGITGYDLVMTILSSGGNLTLSNFLIQSSCGNNLCTLPENNTNCPQDCTEIIPPTSSCIDYDRDGFNKSAIGCGSIFDCNDSNININPGKSEVCTNSIDDNCNDQINENCPVCNNRMKEGTEVCDSDTISCVVNGYTGNKTCNSNCNGYQQCIPNQRCGDGIINGNEFCEGTNLNGQTCLSKGYEGGNLLCNSSCGFVTNSCTTCKLTSAYWSTTSAVENQTVNLKVNGTNCNGKTIGFKVYEDDAAFDEPVNINPINATFSGNTAITTWKTEWQCDGNVLGVCTWGNPQYYFIAYTNSTRTIKSSLLVTQRATADCGNGINETGEQCDDGNEIDWDGCSSSCKTEVTSCQGITQCKNYTNENNCNTNLCNIGSCIWYGREVNRCVLNVDTDRDNVPNEIDRCLTPNSISSSRINKYGCVLPSYSKFSPSLTTNFSREDNLSEIRNLSLGIQDKGKIIFLEIIDVTGVDFDLNVNISDRKIFVNSTVLPLLNKTSVITFYNVPFIEPGIFRDGVNCTNCIMLSYLDNVSTFSVQGFSEYEVVEAYTQPVTPPSGGDTSGGGSGGGGGGSGGSGSYKPPKLNLTSCTPSWECSQWEISQDEKSKTRSCNDKNLCNVSIGKPVQYEIINCEENWICDKWSDLDGDGEECGVRSCTDTNNCGTYNNQPDVELRCIEDSYMSVLFFVIAGLITLGIIFIGFKIWNAKKKN